MLARTRVLGGTPDRVWVILSDGWLYPLWMVGATAMRTVDRSWPDAGAELRHATGTWPLPVEEITTVLESVPGRRLVLSVTSRVLGEARITLTLQPAGERTEIELRCELRHGLRRLLPGFLREVILGPWADETLLRLGFLVERRR